MRLVIIVTLTCLLLSSPGETSKILAIFPFPSKSHYILGESLLRGLAVKGHDVTMISPFSLEKPMKNYEDVVIEGMIEIKDKFGAHFSSFNTTAWDKFKMMYTIFPLFYSSTHNSTNVKKFLKRGEKYDGCIVSFFVMEALYGICDVVKAPPIGFSIVGMSSLLAYHTNNPVPYSYVPNPFLTFTDKMSFLERVQNMVTYVFFDTVIKFGLVPYQARLLKQYYPNAPPLENLLENVDLYLLNSHISTDSPKALLPNVIPIGGYHLQIMDEIPPETRKFLDGSKNGVIYFSMGSNVKSADLDANIKATLIKTLAKLDFDVLWKFEEDLPNKPKNVRIEKWLPQRPILMHPKVKLFMTHGGLGGTVEAIYGGVPMICLPVFADQFKNCAEGVKNGYAITIDLATATEDILLAAANEICEKPEYKEKIMLKSDLYRNQEINPMDKAVFWVEHVIRHKGAKHMKSQAANIPWYQYYLLDVVSLLSAVLLTILYILYFVVKLNLRLLCWAVRKVTGRKCGSKGQSSSQKKEKAKQRLKAKKQK